MSIKVRLLLLVLVAALPILLVNLWTGYEGRQQARQDLEAAGMRFARLIAAQQDRYFRNGRDVLATILHLPQVTEGRRECDEILRLVAGEFPDFTGLGVTDAAGQLGCTSYPEMRPANLADRDYFRAAVASGRLTVGSVMQSETSGRTIIALALPAFDAQGNVRAVAVTGLDLRRLANDVQAESLPPQSDVLIVDANDAVLAQEPPHLPPGHRLTGDLALPAEQRAVRGFVAATGDDGIPRIYGHAPLREAPDIQVMVGLPIAPAIDAANQLFLRQTLLMLAIFAVAGGVAWLLGELSIRRPLLELRRAIDGLGSGDLGARSGLRSNLPELTQLARRFNRMARRLQHHQEDLAQAVKDKEILLREMNHRVKNHLQLVSSLLGLQRSATADAEVRGILEDAQGRVRTLARTHERLYQNDSGGTVEFSGYLEALCQDLMDTTQGDGSGIACRVEAESIDLSIDQAIPLALIVNELYTNAVKYAHPEGGHGEVHIGFARNADGRLCLAVSDDGVGLPPGFDPARSDSLGMRIVAGLAGQLGADLAIDSSGPGARFTVMLPR